MISRDEPERCWLHWRVEQIVQAVWNKHHSVCVHGGVSSSPPSGHGKKADCEKTIVTRINDWLTLLQIMPGIEPRVLSGTERRDIACRNMITSPASARSETASNHLRPTKSISARGARNQTPEDVGPTPFASRRFYPPRQSLCRPFYTVCRLMVSSADVVLLLTIRPQSDAAAFSNASDSTKTAIHMAPMIADGNASFYPSGVCAPRAEAGASCRLAVRSRLLNVLRCLTHTRGFPGALP